MRNATTFTIDPRDAKDFDDALSLTYLPNGNYEIGVHIADVTHYVKPGSIIDREAEERATSVYLVDRVVPMLPEHLCNGICSLRPNEEKLAFSCIFEMNANAQVIKHKIARTVINSNRRFTYEEAQEIIESGHGEYAQEILTLDKLAKILRKERYENGSVEFDRCEVRFNIDETGHPIGVFFKDSIKNSYCRIVVAVVIFLHCIQHMVLVQRLQVLSLDSDYGQHRQEQYEYIS